MGFDGTAATGTAAPSAVLFDRDGTLVRDVPYNGDPALVEILPTVREALDLVRDAGVPVGVVSNQSGVARGLISLDDVRAVNGAIDDLVGPFDVWCVCPHGPDDGCPCRKPRPGLVLDACERLGVDPRGAVVIGDIAADLGAAAAAGATGVLVPTEVTLVPEVLAAEFVASTALEAVELALSGVVTR
ncbi:HAD-IIIA family hydrolase [Labedella phragmitis]|uniref:D,D-heptose 1,7-bisphosphate phosphatase n=1 Tax=Labedella phragmitis TaxID=2498849 RepID=A0A444PUJ6_9MICO|nr:HAD-IIIA family hydrolase [Labedella phragmitis]RWZ51532.1 HAD-IIIA family hydrolase [Labedella phragmitis]